jgi:hypothetical protein
MLISMILIIGFPKAGTTSFDYLLKQLGYQTLHSHNEDHSVIAGELMERARRENKPLLHYIEARGYHAVTEMNFSIHPKTYWPQFTCIHDIIKDYDITYILNKRDIHKHARCLKILQIDEIIKRDNQLTGEIEDIIMKYYDEIKRSIEYYGRTYVEYTIDTDDISKLKPYMDLKGITEFPHMNKTVTRIQDDPIISELSIAAPE